MRGREVSRLEGFSDAVFGFALTLLVVSLEVPESFAALKQTLGGFLPFAATFAMVSWIWFEHYAFFRRFGLEDGLTIVLNLVLLFVVLFFVYPLKFIFTRLGARIAGIGAPAPAPFHDMTAADSRLLMVAYGVGFVAVFAVLALFYRNALRRRAELNLDALGLFDARTGLRRHGLSVAVGLVSISLSLLVPPHLLWLPGLFYCVLGPLHGVNGYLAGRARDRLARNIREAA
jgi:Endosomal/lysosomal potassium channel TMEM175